MSISSPGAAAPASASPMSLLRIRVADVDRAAHFFASLCGWKFQRQQLEAHAEQRLLPARFPNRGAIGAVFHDDAREPPVRLEFEVPDVASTLERALRLGGSGDAAAATDDQGVPLAFAARRVRVDSDTATSHIGVVIL